MPYLDLFWASWLQIERVGRFLCNECNVLVELNLGCNGLTEVTRNFAVTYQAVYATLLTIEWLHDHTSLYTMVFSDVVWMNKAAFGPRFVRPNFCPRSESYSLSHGILELHGVRPSLRVRINRSTIGTKAVVQLYDLLDVTNMAGRTLSQEPPLKRVRKGTKSCTECKSYLMSRQLLSKTIFNAEC